MMNTGKKEKKNKKKPRLAMSLLIDIAQCCKIILKKLLKFHVTFCVQELLLVIQGEQKTTTMVFCYQNCWPTVRKKCSSDRENILKFEAKGQVFAKILRSLEQFVQTVKSQNNFLVTECFFNLVLEVSQI